MPDPKPVYRLTLTPTGEGPPGPIRLRAILKAALRRFGLRCVGVEEVPPAGTTDGPGPQNPPPPAA
jgi:hypothetical protein